MAVTRNNYSFRYRSTFQWSDVIANIANTLQTAGFWTVQSTSGSHAYVHPTAVGSDDIYLDISYRSNTSASPTEYFITVGFTDESRFVTVTGCEFKMRFVDGAFFDDWYFDLTTLTFANGKGGAMMTPNSNGSCSWYSLDLLNSTSTASVIFNDSLTGLDSNHVASSITEKTTEGYEGLVTASDAIARPTFIKSATLPIKGFNSEFFYWSSKVPSSNLTTFYIGTKQLLKISGQICVVP